jgi:hypothetical protein
VCGPPSLLDNFGIGNLITDKYLSSSRNCESPATRVVYY